MKVVTKKEKEIRKKFKVLTDLSQRRKRLDNLILRFE